MQSKYTFRSADQETGFTFEIFRDEMNSISQPSKITQPDHIYQR